MTALDITYEDGLRLSELSGAMESLRYELGHIIQVNLPALIMISIAAGLICAMVWLMFYPSEPGFPERFDSEEQAKAYRSRIYTYKVLSNPVRVHKVNGIVQTTQERIEVEWRVRSWVPAVCILTFVLLYLVMLSVFYIYLQADIEMQMASTQAQIDAIMAKYGGGA